MHELFTYNLDEVWALPEEEKEVNFSRFAIMDVDNRLDDENDVWLCEHCDHTSIELPDDDQLVWLEDIRDNKLLNTVFCEICGRCSNPHCDCQEHY